MTLSVVVLVVYSLTFLGVTGLVVYRWRTQPNGNRIKASIEALERLIDRFEASE